jgi:hypothetical protein
MAVSLGIPHSTLHYIRHNMSEDVIMPHSSALKPFLSEENKVSCTLYCIDHLTLHAGENHDNNPDNDFGFYDDFQDQIHIDEKWFFVKRDMMNIYLAAGEKIPGRNCVHKGHIQKVMFLCAVARPRGAWDGKIGIWPFVEQIPAARNSANRVAGTLETKCVNVTKEVYGDMIINKVLPMVKEKWPAGASKVIFLQHDNASCHFKKDWPQWMEACEAAAVDGWEFKLTGQPPNSPDLNILDLGFFRALQSAQWDFSESDHQTSKDDLILAVKAAFEGFDHRKLNFNFLTLQSCVEEILRCHGDNTYRIPQIEKEHLDHMNELPQRLEASGEAIEIAMQFFDNE